MGQEIERKFLVRREKLPEHLPQGDELEQGYLSVDPTVRVHRWRPWVNSFMRARV